MPEGLPPSRLVFVYGTLRRGECNDIHRFNPTPEPVGEGWAAGLLYDLGPYPGARFADPCGHLEAEAGSCDRIRGEIYRVTADVEALLDQLEDVRADGQGEYLRREVLVFGAAGGQPLNCLAYEIQAERVRHAPRISGGDWCHREALSGAPAPSSS
ncbi:gamma-glutamylcyclotransferase [Xenophilus arseniciresistens]|uniref:Gamma-glutamylcyclotransferase n=1 Tax=Xenophilus arseniciresistens TaxID=1283306 RepID=A0AAE3N7M3_9BURK|nr:gamma-glutamylcyclotransferase family protein [Xenophilus arseniciresistens]MDA7416068.1 gamma-glutamylcyclotransferase [Xenophilus arseniciresistens]